MEPCGANKQLEHWYDLPCNEQPCLPLNFWAASWHGDIQVCYISTRFDREKAFRPSPTEKKNISTEFEREKPLHLISTTNAFSAEAKFD